MCFYVSSFAMQPHLKIHQTLYTRKWSLREILMPNVILYISKTCCSVPCFRTIQNLCTKTKQKPRTKPKRTIRNQEKIQHIQKQQKTIEHCQRQWKTISNNRKQLKTIEKNKQNNPKRYKTVKNVLSEKLFLVTIFFSMCLIVQCRPISQSNKNWTLAEGSYKKYWCQVSSTNLTCCLDLGFMWCWFENRAETYKP